MLGKRLLMIIFINIFFLAKSLFKEPFDNSSDQSIFENVKSTSSLRVCETYDIERDELIQKYIKENKEKLSEEDISLIKFIAGDCLPVIIFPGFYANKFQLQITNCTAINEFHPNIAKACGYDKKCKEGFEEMFWLSENFETDDNKTCFGELGKFNLKRNETETDIKKKFYEEVYRGFRLTYWGNTPQTEDKNECGFGASTNLLDKKFYFGKKSVRGMRDIKKHFLNLGYKVGVNLFSVPFDWRRNSNHEYNFHLAKQSVDLAYNLTGKPAVLVGHSYGSIIALNYLYSIPQEEKEQKISRLITVGPPLTGANKSIKGFIIGFEEMNIKIKLLSFKIIDLYFSIQNQKIMLYNTPAPLEMFPKFFWDIHKEDEWMNVIRARSKVENSITQCVRNYFKEKYDRSPNDELVKESSNYFNEILDQFEEINGKEEKSDFINFLESEEDSNSTHYSNEKHLKYYEVLKYKVLNSKNDKTSTSNEEDKEIYERCIEKNKLESEKDLINFKKLFPYFPDLEQGCGIQKVNDATCLKLPYCKTSIWDKYCRLNFMIPLDQPMVQIKDGEDIDSFHLVTKEDIIKMIKKYGMATPDLEYLEYVFEILNPDLHALNHPGVPVTVYYSDFSMTVVGFNVPENPKKYTDADKLVIDVLGPEIIKYEAGDGTVPTSNVIVPPLKWSLDKEHGNKYPIHFVSYCTNKQYAGSDIKYDEHQYMNLECECKSPSAEACSHSSMITDVNIINHLTKYSINSRNSIDINILNQKIDLVGKNINHIENGMICSNLKKVNEMFVFYQ
jgi:hypothetical protein